MATPNYGYEKRQKELAKKRKKEDKLKSKSERKVGGEHGDMPSDVSQDGADSAEAASLPTESPASSAP